MTGRLKRLSISLREIRWKGSSPSSNGGFYGSENKWQKYFERPWDVDRHSHGTGCSRWALSGQKRTHAGTDRRPFHAAHQDDRRTDGLLLAGRRGSGAGEIQGRWQGRYRDIPVLRRDDSGCRDFGIGIQRFLPAGQRHRHGSDQRGGCAGGRPFQSGRASWFLGNDHRLRTGESGESSDGWQYPSDHHLLSLCRLRTGDAARRRERVHEPHRG